MPDIFAKLNWRRGTPFLALAILLAGIAFWYQGKGTPLSSDEVNHYMQVIAAQQQEPGGRHNHADLRAFLAADDGKPFYTVNLYRFHPTARYLEPQDTDISGEEAFSHFSKAMIRLLASHGSHPVFGTEWADKSISRWDRLVIVRYRSRRDIAELFATDEFADAAKHKWAALAENERMLVQGVHIPEFRLLLWLLFACSGVMLVLRLRRKQR